MTTNTKTIILNTLFTLAAIVTVGELIFDGNMTTSISLWVGFSLYKVITQLSK